MPADNHELLLPRSRSEYAHITKVSDPNRPGQRILKGWPSISHLHQKCRMPRQALEAILPFYHARKRDYRTSSSSSLTTKQRWENSPSGIYAKPRCKQAEGTHRQVWSSNVTKNKRRRCVCSAEQIVRLRRIIPSPLPSLSTPRRA